MEKYLTNLSANGLAQSILKQHCSDALADKLTPGLSLCDQPYLLDFCCTYQLGLSSAANGVMISGQEP